MGYQPIDMGINYWLRIFPFILITTFMMPIKITRPSDFLFIFFNGLIVLPYVVLHPILGPITYERFLLNMVVLLLPLLIVNVFRKFKLRIRVPSVMATETAFWVVLVAAIAGSFYILTMLPGSAGFSVDLVGLRRLESREILISHSLPAYASSITMNGLLPMISFCAGLRNKWLWLVVALSCALVFYYAIGIKAHFLLVCFAWLIGRNIYYGQLSRTLGQAGQIIMLFFFCFSLLNF